MAPIEVLAQVSEGGPAAAPARSARRATARRASARRASARRLQSDTAASIMGFLTAHAGSTVGDLARRLDLDPEQVGSCLTQLTSTGEIDKAPNGYSTRQPDVPSNLWP
jgi:hypothetical protein